MLSLSLSLLRSICCVSNFRYSNLPLQKEEEEEEKKRRKRRRKEKEEEGEEGGGSDVPYTRC